MLAMRLASLVSPDDHWVLWATVIAIAALSIYLEQTYKWAGKLSSPVVALLFSVTLANINVLPNSAPAYDAIQGYCIPVGIVMLLFRADIKKIIKDTGKAFICFNIAAVGTFIGAFVAFLAVGRWIPDAAKITGTMAASYIGGGVNFFAVADSVHPAESIIGSAVVADNFVMALVILIGMTIPTLSFIRKHYNHPHELAAEKASATDTAKTRAAGYWGRKEMSLLDIAKTVSIAFVIAAVSVKIAGFLGTLVVPDLLSMIISNQFVIITIVAVTLASVFPKFFSELRGSQEIGTFMIALFFVVIGFPASIKDIILGAPMLFVLCAIMAAVNIIIMLLAAKPLKLNIEESMLATNATIGGPSTAAAMAVAKGWESLVVPGILIGLWGYIIGTPIGLIVVDLLEKMG